MSETENRGFHPTLAEDHPYIFIDGCMQAWPDADFENAHLHGCTVFGVTAWLPQLPVNRALEGLMYWHLVARRHPDVSVIRTVADIRRAKLQRGAGLLLASQCGAFISDKLHRIEAFYRLGLRMMIPAYSANNQVSGGCLDRGDVGLSRFGQLVVEECNRVGMLIDCSHLSRRSSMEIIDQSLHPVLFSHSNAKALVANPRNIDDEQILACSARGGVIGLTPWGPLVMREDQSQRPVLADFLDHIDHITDLTGSADHVALGTDMSLGSYAHATAEPWGTPRYADVVGRYNQLVGGTSRSPLRFCDGFSMYPDILTVIEGLQARGFSDVDTAKILGENFLRVAEQVWK